MCFCQKSWTKKWPCIQQVIHDKHSFYCTLCRREVSCAHQAERDVIQHMKSDKHKKIQKKFKNEPAITTTDPIVELVKTSYSYI